MAIPVHTSKLQPSKPLHNGAQESVDDPLEVECSRGEHDIDGVSEESLVEITSQTVVCLAMPDDWLYSRPLPEERVLLRPHVFRVRLPRHIRNHDLGIACPFLPAVASVSSQYPDLPAVYPSDLCHGPVYRVTVVLVAERQGSNDKAIPEADQGHLVAELVFPMLLSLADTKYIGFMKRIYLVTINLLTINELQTQIKPFPAGTAGGQFTEQLTDQPAGNGTHPAVCPGNLLATVCPAAEPLCTLQFLHLAPVALTDGDILLAGYLVTVFDNLVKQLGVRRKRYVLLLDSGVDKSRLLMVRLPAPAILVLILLSLLPVVHQEINPDALLENHLNT